MALSKETVVAKAEVLQSNSIQVRTDTIIKEDGTEISRSIHRTVVNPYSMVDGSWVETDLSKVDAKVKAIAEAIWTDDVKKAYKEMVDAQTNLGD
jgi:hypothetical protein|tara:strand:+ start:687 stop:971 length:285 start_codon:yes stop_codon:yes gene_type:complete